jgi:hypothetical protein
MTYVVSTKSFSAEPCLAPEGANRCCAVYNRSCGIRLQLRATPSEPGRCSVVPDLVRCEAFEEPVDAG